MLLCSVQSLASIVHVPVVQTGPWDMAFSGLHG